MACTKTDTLPFYASGTAPTLSSDVTAVAPAPSDSDNVVLTLSWSDPGYATDASTVKYLIQIDSSGGDFSNAATRVVSGNLSAPFVAKDLNAILLGFGFQFDVQYSIDIRIISSYANNNDQKISNTITLEVTPYVVPAKVLPPANGTLYIIGGATAGGWDQPVPVPAQQFTRIDSLTYQGTFYLKGGGSYDILPTNGSWAEKYNVADASVAGISAGGDFQYSTGPGNDIPAPGATGMYTIWLDFQHGIFTVTPVNIFSQLYVPGGYQSTQWDPPSAPALASPNNDGNYEGYVNVPAGGSYEFKITSDPDWTHTIYGDDGAGGLSSGGGNLSFPGPGYYKMNVDLNNNTYTLTATSWGMIGSFVGSAWGSDVDMTYDAGSSSWKTTITLADGDEFKFRSNHDWGLNYGDSGADGSLEQNGDNLKGYPAGTYNVTLYLNNAGYYTYKLVKQ
jgi:hypothetical protein